MKNNYNVLKIFFVMLIIVAMGSQAYSAGAMDYYRELSSLDQNPSTSRQSYKALGDKFYKLYTTDPSARGADESLLGAARVYRRAYERYKIDEDLEKTLRYYNTLQGAFNSAAAREAYIEASDVFKQRGDYSSARFTLNKLITKYPDTSQAKTASQKINDLNKVSSAPAQAPTPVPVGTPISTAKPTQVASTNTPNTNIYTPKDTKEEVKVSTPASRPAGDVIVKGIRYFSDKDYTRVVIDLSDPAQYESRWFRADPTIDKPSRLSIDINSSNIDADIVKQVNIKDGLLSAVRLGYHAPEKRTRIVLDSENVKDFTVSQLSSPSRIVVDVYSTDRGLNSTGSTPQATATASTSNSASNRPAPKTTASGTKVTQTDSDMTLGAALGLKIKTVVIDAGHGGKDPGAVANGLYEKDIVLDISKQVHKLLSQDKSLTVHLTRSTDIFIPLEERTAIANKHKADLFVSIHANAAKNINAFGIETYVFNVTNDKAALEVAALENQATTKSISDLQGILKDILIYSKLEESLSLASYVQKHMVGATSAKNLGVKQAPFYVLVGATMPSILVEVGFMSNKDEAAKLKTAAYRAKLSDGIYKGLKDYIAKYNN